MQGQEWGLKLVIDLHCHLLPGIDDGARDMSMSLAMARAFVDQGVEIVACTPHILPGLYHNTGPQISQAVAALRIALQEHDIPLQIVAGADNHVVPDFVGQLQRGHLLTLANSRYVLVEPPHHVAPPQLDQMFFNILASGFCPILTHPERLSWIEQKYSLIRQLAAQGVWMQITCGSLRGAFGRRAQYWGEKMLDEGIVHLLATDAHDPQRRRPDLAEGRRLAERRVGATQAQHLVLTRPKAVVDDAPAYEAPAPAGRATNIESGGNEELGGDSGGGRSHIADRLRRFFAQ